eukprot:13717791-Ditylum_brightwellii.AAC.1
MVSNLVEMIRVENNTAEHVAQQHENCWLLHYPCPVKCIHNNGGKLIGDAFQMMLQRNEIKDSSITSCNLQANAVCERLHQMVANILRTTTNNKANNYQESVILVDDALVTAMHQQNLKHREYDYAVGHKVLIKAVNPAKLEPKAHVPYAITQVFNNGTKGIIGMKM